MYLSENFIIYVALAATLILAGAMLLSTFCDAYKRYKASESKNK